MVPGGTAASCGKLRVGDRILKVNGTDVTQATHQEAVMELLRPGDTITLTIRHDPLPEGYQVIACIVILCKVVIISSLKPHKYFMSTSFIHLNNI